MKNWLFHNDNIHTHFNQNRFINKCTRVERKAKVPTLIKTEFHHYIFFVRRRRTYVLNKRGWSDELLIDDKA